MKCKKEKNKNKNYNVGYIGFRAKKNIEHKKIKILYI